MQDSADGAAARRAGATEDDADGPRDADAGVRPGAGAGASLDTDVSAPWDAGDQAWWDRDVCRLGDDGEITEFEAAPPLPDIPLPDAAAVMAERTALAGTYDAVRARAVDAPTMASGDWRTPMPGAGPGAPAASPLDPIRGPAPAGGAR